MQVPDDVMVSDGGMVRDGSGDETKPRWGQRQRREGKLAALGTRVSAGGELNTK
jgi:hypothetical protein